MNDQPLSDADWDQLYVELSPQLQRILGAHLQVPAWVLEDACQIAWTTLLADPGQVDRARTLSWLATTARREALAMLRRAEIEQRVVGQSPTPEPEDPQRSAEFWERLGRVRRLSRRQQRIVWMQGMGFRYDEIAAETGETLRSVERQLSAARRQLDSAA